MRIKFYTYLIIGAAILASCTGVDTVDHIEGTNRWNVSFNWGSESSRPDSMLIIANRAINTYRYVYNWNTSQNKGLLMCESTDLGYKKNNLNVDSLNYDPTDTLETTAGQIANGQLIASQSTSDFDVRPGQYTALTASLNKDIVYTCLGKTGFSQFMDSTVSTRDICMYYKTVNADSVFKQTGRKWNDFNPSEKFVNDAGPLYFSEIKQITVGQGNGTQITFTPKEFTQHLTINFDILLRGDVKIDEVVGSISGIPACIRMSSLYQNTGGTRKMAFKATRSNASDSVVNCTASLVVPGLLASSDTLMLTGPSVLQIVVFAKATDDRGRNITKTIYVGKNVSNEIREGEFSKMGDDNLHFVANMKDITIGVKKPIIIDRKTILEMPDDHTTLGEWIKDEDFTQGEDIEI